MFSMAALVKTKLRLSFKNAFQRVQDQKVIYVKLAIDKFLKELMPLQNPVKQNPPRLVRTGAKTGRLE